MKELLIEIFKSLKETIKNIFNIMDPGDYIEEKKEKDGK